MASNQYSSRKGFEKTYFSAKVEEGHPRTSASQREVEQLPQAPFFEPVIFTWTPTIPLLLMGVESWAVFAPLREGSCSASVLLLKCNFLRNPCKEGGRVTWQTNLNEGYFAGNVYMLLLQNTQRVLIAQHRVQLVQSGVCVCKCRCVFICKITSFPESKFWKTDAGRWIPSLESP